MDRVNSNKFLFISSNIFYFLTILFTYLDLRKFEIQEKVYFNQFSFTTYAIIIFFLINLFLLLVYESKDKYKIFNIFIYYLVLSSGSYIINFPIMDELILLTSSFFFLIQFFINKKIPYSGASSFFILIFGILFLQSIIGLIFDFRSIRYIILYPCLILSFYYFSNLKEIDNEKHKIFLNYLFYGILLYVAYQFFFWYLKFYIFEMKFLEQKFIGDMQPSFAKSSSGHFDAIHILSGYLVLFFSMKSDSFVKTLILFLSIVGFWIMADSRSSLFLLYSISIFYFFIAKSKNKIFIITLLILVLIQKDYFDNSFNRYVQRAQNAVIYIFTVDEGTQAKTGTYKLNNEELFYQDRVTSNYDDFGRLSYVLSGLNSIKYNPVKVFFGCGFYSYYYCAQEAQIEVHDKYNVPMTEIQKGSFNKSIRPTAAGTILVENGFLIILMGVLFYLKFIKKKIFFSKGKLLIKSKVILISLYLFLTILCWTLFSNLLDIVFIYLFLMPILRKYLFYKI